ncbi:MAG: hypothetical protein ACKOYP_09865 [Bacteroidota bacterium]
MRKAAISTICLLLALIFSGQAIHGHCCAEDVACLTSAPAAEDPGKECPDDGQNDDEKIFSITRLTNKFHQEHSPFRIHHDSRLISISADILSPPPKG